MGDPKEHPNSVQYLAIQVAWHELPKDDVRGVPQFYAIQHGPEASVLFTYPTPDKDYFAVFRYCPAAKEI